MTDRWQTTAIVCRGGLDRSTEILSKSLSDPGVAITLTNFEPAIDGGYYRVQGYQPYTDSLTVVPANTGFTTTPILAVKVAFSTVLAYRQYDTNDYRVYSLGGTTWTQENADVRTGTITKARFFSYFLFQENCVLTDGANPALKLYASGGISDTLINGTGAPADPKYAALFAGRLVLAGYSSNKSALSLSAPNDDTDFDAANDAIELNVGDEIVGLKTFRDVLYIFCQNSIFSLSGSTTDDFIVKAVTTELGCISADSIVEVGGDVLFLAADGIRTIAATERVGDIELASISKKINPVIRDLIGSYSANAFSACAINKKSQYRLFYYNANIADSTQGGILGKLEGRDNGLQYAWSQLKGFPVYCCDSAYVGSSDQEFSIFGHPTNGIVYKMESGNGLNGEAIEAVYQTPYLSLGEDPEIRKVIHKIRVFTEAYGDFQTILECLLDFENTNILQPPAILVDTSAGGDVYGSAVYGTSLYASVSAPIIERNLIGSGKYISFRFTDSSTRAPFRIDSFTLQYATKGRR